MGVKKQFSLFVLFLFFWQTPSIVAQTQASVKKRADQAFSQQKYAEALPDYRQLLAKDPQNPKLNFCYGVCVFEVVQHFEAAKYFDVAIGLKHIPDPLLYYYRARIYQEQYFFTQAILTYQTYQKLTLDQKAALNVRSHIEECERAQMEIKQFSQLPLLSVASTSNLKFYNVFPFDPEDFSFYEAPEVHRKNNAKHQHVPVYAYKRGMKYRILASYGPKGEQLDLYLQRKDVANNWAEPVLINGGVNGLVSDESFGFYDATTKTLYFTSTANSIGASDLYMASYDLNANIASNVERMPYPYSSPVDDLFYVTDPAQQRAYFATTRQAKVGQYEIYTLELDQPVQLRFVFSGHFYNDLEPLSKTVSLRFKSLNSQEAFGPYVSDSDGNYTVALPSSGDYELEISVSGASKVYTTRFGIPKLAPGKGLQQVLRYGTDDYGQEKWQVLNQIFESEPTEQLASLAKLQLDVAKGNLLQTSPQLSSSASTQTNLAASWGIATQDTATFVSILTDSLLAAEVSLENQVRLMDLLRQDFEKQLNTRESLLAELSTLLLNSDNQDQKLQVLATLNEVEDKLGFIKRWIAINQEANIPDLVLLDTLQQLNERNQLLLHMGDTLLLLERWQERQVAIQQYLQIAAFDGASAIAAAQLEQQLRLEQIIKEEATNKEQQRQLTQQINKLQADQALLSKKEQAQTKLEMEALQVNLADVSAHAEQLRILRESQAKEVEIYDQDQLKALYLKESENQSLPKVDFQVTYDELLAQYAQQGSLSEQLKADVHLNTMENGNLSSTVQSSTKEQTIPETTIPEPSIEEPIIQETTIPEPSIEEPIIQETTNLEPSIEEASIQETTIPEPSIKEASIPETTNPEPSIEELTIQETTIPEPSIEEASIPETTIPEPSIEEASIPETTVSEPSIEELTIQETTIPEPSIEEASIQETTIPEPSIEEAYIQETTVSEPSIEEASIQETAVPEPSIEEASIPETTNPEPSIEELTIQETTIPEPSIEGASIPETTIPEPSIEEASIPETTVSEPSIEELTIQETTIPEPSIEEASIQETTVPEPSISAPETSYPKNENINPEHTNLTQRVHEFTQQFEALSNLNDLDINQLPVLERVGLTNEELDTLALALTLPSSKNNAPQVLANNMLTTEAEIQGYINYLAERRAFEQTKEELLQNQIAIRALEENYEPQAQQKLLDLLVSQTALLAQLSNQKQNLLQVENQAQLEALMLDNYKPEVTTLASMGQTALGQVSSKPTTTFQRQQIPTNLAPLPVGLPCPEGLVFRVQVGAFRKPVPAARFREFTPVDGQVLANGLTVYMAGYFQSSTEALQQQKLIRSLGYTDAFVVAYQNCTRLSLAQGRALEKQVVTATTNMTTQSSHFAGPGQGLYYSVQVGVYNRPLTSEAQLGLNELIEVRTAKGQYRYASGKFTNIQEAKIRQQQAVGKGITDAFIVAYYDGKRIDLAQAKLLSQSGIQFETFQTVQPQQVLTAQLQQQIQTLQIPEMKKVILPDPISRYEIRCSDCPSELSRYNRVGIFIYDDQKELIISAVQKESQWDLVQQMYLKEMRKRNASLKGATQTLLLEQRNLDGAFMDWILRQHNGYELFKDEQGQLQLRYILPLQE